MSEIDDQFNLKIDYQSSYADDVSEKSNDNYDPYAYVYAMYDIDEPEEYDFEWGFVE